MKEIGGYFELETFYGQEYYPHLLKFNLGRTALLFLLHLYDVKRLYVPYYLCDSVTDSCKKAGYSLTFYSIDRDMRPILPDSLLEDEYLYLVNYYGQLTDDKICEYKKIYPHIIVDHTQSFFQAPVNGVPTLYSCRKFFGLPDGAYLSCPTLSSLDNISLDTDCSNHRMEHILGRYEHSASETYSLMLKNAHSFPLEPIKKMSHLTQNLLRGINYTSVVQKRNSNYHFLQDLLQDRNPLKWRAPNGAFAYPFYYPDGIALRKALAKNGIYVTTYWSNVLHEMPAESVEYDYAANILALPCDQRYGNAEMNTVARTCKKCIVDLETENGK